MLRSSFGRFQEMDDGVQRRGYEDRHTPAPGFQKNAENESAEKSFLDNWDDGRGSSNFCNCWPIDCSAQRKNWRRKQERAAAEEGNGREDDACEQISPSLRISRELQIIQAADFERSNEWPKQDRCGDEQRAMKKSFEVVSREKS